MAQESAAIPAVRNEAAAMQEDDDHHSGPSKVATSPPTLCLSESPVQHDECTRNRSRRIARVLLDAPLDCFRKQARHKLGYNMAFGAVSINDTAYQTRVVCNVNIAASEGGGELLSHDDYMVSDGWHGSKSNSKIP